MSRLACPSHLHLLFFTSSTTGGMPILSATSLLVSYPPSKFPKFSRDNASQPPILPPEFTFQLSTNRKTLKISYEKKRQAHNFILYFFKTIHHQIVHYGRDGTDKADLVRQVEAKRARKGIQPHSAFARVALSEGLLDEALFHFTHAINCNTLSSQDYCGRAETSIKMEKYESALTDCWRSMVLDQKHSSKPFYNASQCYYELGYLKQAREMNKQAMNFCCDEEQRELIEAQSLYIEKAKIGQRLNRYPRKSESEADHVEEEKANVVFRKLQCEGSALYQSRKFSEAADKFHQALEMVTSLGLEALETQAEDTQLLTYCYALACVHTGTSSNLQYAIEKFNYVISEGFNLAASHYGLGLAYKHLNRFSEALAEFHKAAERRRTSTRLQWPQTLITLEETDPESLQKLLKSLIRECKNPPKPDAICKFHLDGESSRTEIYRSDPDYKGFIRLLCNCRCCIEFHSSCWKIYRHNRGEHIDKEMLDKECPTPNCWGFIVHISIFKLDLDHPIEMTSSKKFEATPSIRKPAIKMKTTNALKLQKKAEKKQWRRERREEDRKKKAEEAKLLEESLTSDSQADTSHYRDKENDLPDVNVSNQKFTVLMTKEQDNLMENKAKQKVSKPKKKKEKTKQVLTFDLQFSADKDKELLGLNNLDDDGDFTSQPGLMGSPRVTSLHHPPVAAAVSSSLGLMPNPIMPLKPVSQGNGLLPLPLKPKPIIDVFLQNLIECFVTVLQGGPQELGSSIVQDILGSAPSETRARVAAAGGVAAFLGSQPQFIVAGGKVGLARGGPGLLSNGPSTATRKIPNGGGSGAGLLDTPALAGTSAWGSGVRTFETNNTQKGLLGSFPLASYINNERLDANLRLNPSATEFIPGLRKNSLDNAKTEPQNGVEEDKTDGTGAGRQEEADEDGSGEFVTVTHKKSSHSAKQSLKAGGHNSKILPYQNGVVANMYSVLREEQSSAEDSSAGSAASTIKSAASLQQSYNKPPSPLTAAFSKESGASIRSATKSSSSILAAAPPPPLPLSITSVGAAARGRAVSDASSTLSEDVRACSPNSLGSHVSQGSSNSNSNPCSSSIGQQAAIEPLQPLKAVGLNFPKRAKRRDLLREKKIFSLGGSQPSVTQVSSQNSSSVKSQGAMGEVDDVDSLGSDSISDKDGSNGLDAAPLAPAISSQGSLSENKPGKVQTHVLSESDQYLQELESYSEDKSSTYPRNGGSYLNSESYLSNVHGGETLPNPPHLQGAVVGNQRRKESRVLRNLGLSSHSPSPPPPLDKSSISASGQTAVSSRSSSTASKEEAHQGHMFDSSGNFRSALSNDDLWQDVEISSPAAQRTSQVNGSQAFTEQTKGVSYQGVGAAGTADPWAKPANQIAGSKYGLGDLLYGGEDFPKSDPFFPSHHDADYSSATTSFLSQLHGGGSADATTSFLSQLQGSGSADATTSFLSQLHGGGSADATTSFLSQLQGSGSAEASFKVPSKPESLVASSALLSTAGVGASDIRTWSPLSSDSQSRGQGESKAGFQAWPSSFAQGEDKQDALLDENPFAFTLYKEKSQGPLKTIGSDPLFPSMATSWAGGSSLQATAPPVKSLATVSVNTDLTGEKLKSLQLKFYEVKDDRDSLRAKVKAEQEEKEREKSQRLELKTRLTEVTALMEKQGRELEDTKRHAETVGKERDSLNQAMKEALSKARQLDEVKILLQNEVLKVKHHEKQILNLNVQAALTTLEMRRKEACSHMYKIDGIIHRIRNIDQIADPALVEKHKEWEDYVKACEAAIKDVLETHKSGVQALDEGQSLDEVLPLRSPFLPAIPTPPSEQSLIGRPRPKVQPPPVQTEPDSATSRPDSPEDEESAFLKMLSQGAAPTEQEKSNLSRAAEPAAPMRLPPGLPRRPLSQGPIPLNNLPPRPAAAPSSSSVSSSSSSASSGLASIKLPSRQHVARPSLASIAATMVPQSSLHQSQASGQPRPSQPQPQQTSIFDRLVRTIQETFPDFTRPQIQRIIEELRRENGGSLARFSFDRLAHSIVEKIVDGEGETGHPKAGAAAAQRLHREETGSTGRQGQRNARAGSPPELTCTICHDDMEPGCGQEIRVLDCGHRFHEDCIQSWLRVNQTCPNCRSHSLLEEDFPSLRKF
ncbi:E3 ubiquitin-protein ligase TTC3 [Elysia marginata]|uniref:E3 ubiquitin-protein ligase TTC3 n=1 Tax=Elysia marginata TaxID=1093978 RepID=A0AAV4K1F6_9GAST|nr:E3 ubiquitin-protein ligase TTC3 [Elysia marginata]